LAGERKGIQLYKNVTPAISKRSPLRGLLGTRPNNRAVTQTLIAAVVAVAAVEVMGN